MPSAVLFMQWDSYQDGGIVGSFFRREPLTFNSRQERLHQLAAGDCLWLVSRCPDDQQYYFVGLLHITDRKRNSPDSEEGRRFGEYAVVGDRSRSQDLGKRFRADGLLRAFEFQTDRPIKHGASIGQSLQTLRLLNSVDERILQAALQRLLKSERLIDAPFGLWTKCDRTFADYFLANWQQRQEPLAFLLYDSPPMLASGSPVFIHSDKSLRLLAKFRESQFVSAHKFTADAEERRAERERVWETYRATTVNPPSKNDFDAFWEKQHGVRGLFIMDRVIPLPKPPPFKSYGRLLEWGYPTGVGYRYLTLSQSYCLLRMAQLSVDESMGFVDSLLQTG